MVIIAIIFALYLGLMVVIGIKYYSKSDTLSKYILGGRTLNPWMSAMSAQASDMSGWLLIGLPGTAYVIYQGNTHLYRVTRSLCRTSSRTDSVIRSTFSDSSPVCSS